MSYVNMKEMLRHAKKNGYAIGAFNIINYLTAVAVTTAAEEAKTPVIIQTSASTVKQIGAELFIGFLKAIAEKASIPVAVHLDHCVDKNMVKKCIDVGWSSVMYDGSKESFEDNIRNTAEIVKYAEAVDVSVEGELGAIVGVEDDIKVDEDESIMADPQKSLLYVEATGVHAFAPAIGTAHGMYKGNPKIDFDRFKKIEALVESPLVVHGGTGLTRDIFKRLIGLGAAKINVSTAIKIIYTDALYSYIETHRSEYNPLKLERYVEDSVKATVLEHIEIFGIQRQGKTNLHMDKMNIS